METGNARDSVAAASTTDGAYSTKVRYLILALVACAPALAYLTRNQAALATTIQRDFGLSDIGLGTVLGGFALGYFWLQVPGGWFADRFGVRIALPTIGLAWSLCAYWSSAASSPLELWLSRIALGLAQAGLVPTCAKALGEWFPARERGMASAAIAGGMQLGAAAAQGAAYFLLATLGWRGLLAMNSLLSVVWVVVFTILYRNRPEEDRWVNQQEVRLIRASPNSSTDTRHAATDLRTRPPRASAATVAWLMFTSLTFWAVCMQGFFRSFAYEFFSTWFPAYLEQGRNVSLSQSNLLAMMPIVTIGVGSLLGGITVDVLFRLTGSKRISRSGTAVVAMTLCAAAVAAAAFTRNTTLAVAIIALGQLAAGLAAACTWAATLDIGGRYMAFIFAVMNTIGNVGSYACPVTVGHLVDYIKKTNGDWNLVLYLFVAVNLAAAACWLVLDPNRQVVPDTPNPT